MTWIGYEKGKEVMRDWQRENIGNHGFAEVGREGYGLEIWLEWYNRDHKSIRLAAEGHQGVGIHGVRR